VRCAAAARGEAGKCKKIRACVRLPARTHLLQRLEGFGVAALLQPLLHHPVDLFLVLPHA